MAVTGALARQAQPERLPSRIPSRNPTVRRRTREVFAAAPWLSVVDLPAVVRLCDLREKHRRLGETLDRLGENGLVVVKDKDVAARKVVESYRAIGDSVLKLEIALGLVPTSRAGLGVNLGRVLDLAGLMSAEADHGG